MRRSSTLLACVLHLLAGTAYAANNAAGPAAADAAVDPAMDPVGAWAGSLLGVAGPVAVVLRVAPAPTGGLEGRLDVPARGIFDQSVAVRADGGILDVDIDALRARFRGAQAGELLEGTWAQGEWRVPLYLRRTSRDAARRRPQDPTGPLPYRVRAVSFRAPDGVRLAGTLELPRAPGPHPAVVLVAGSGPHDRDGAVAGHRPFLVLADHLVRRGIAVLRFDERGVGESGGDFAAATTADLAADVDAALDWLLTQPEVDAARTGLLGHSEGGVIAPMVAAGRDDVAFLVLLGAPGVPLRSVALRQAAEISRAEGMGEAWIAAHVDGLQRIFDMLADPRADDHEFEPRARVILERAHARSPLPADATRRTIDALLAAYALPWTRFAFRYDPGPVLRTLRMPVLALNGALDTQVCPATNLAAIGRALREGGNRDVHTHELPGLNHYFQAARTGAVSEYGVLDETFSPVALALVGEWITARSGVAAAHLHD